MGRLKAFDNLKAPKPKKQVPKPKPVVEQDLTPPELNQEVMATIKQRRLQILVHSSIYYTFDNNVVDDHTYNKWALELSQLQSKYPKESEEVKEYYEEFKEWQGEQCGSGFNLPIRQPWVLMKARYLINRKYNS